MDETYYQALAFCQKSTREDGIDAALRHNGTQLSALLVPPEVGQTYQIAAQAGKFQNLVSSYHMVLSNPAFPLKIFKKFPLLNLSSFHNLDLNVKKINTCYLPLLPPRLKMFQPAKQY